MIPFNKYLKEQLKNKKFGAYYNEELELLKFAFKLSEQRILQGKSQSDMAKKAHLTQQQFSKVENGDNCNIMTYLKACHAVGLTLTVQPVRRTRSLIRRGKAPARVLDI